MMRYWLIPYSLLAWLAGSFCFHNSVPFWLLPVIGIPGILAIWFWHTASRWIIIPIGLMALLGWSMSFLAVPPHVPPMHRVHSQVEILNEPEARQTTYRVPVRDTVSRQRYVLTSRVFPGHLGEVVRVQGELRRPDPPTNPGQLDYGRYLAINGYSGQLAATRITPTAIRHFHPVKTLAFRCREWLIQAHSRSLPAPYNALFIGLLFGDQGVALPQDMTDRFRTIGLMHILVVSGAQVALISGLVMTTGRLLGLRSWPLAALVLVINAFFYVMTGGGASIFRAVLMNALAIIFQTIHRRTTIYHIMSAIALFMCLLDPMNAVNIGFWLSFAATFALVYGAKQLETGFDAATPPWLTTMLSVTLAPFLFTTPILLYVFHTFSPVSLISNLIVVNWIEWIVVLGFISSLLMPILAPVSALINQCVLLLMVLLDGLSRILDKLPYGNIAIANVNLILVGLLVAWIMLCIELWRRQKRRFLLWAAGAGTGIGIFLLFLHAIPGDTLTIQCLDVGQGDALLITTPRHHHYLIDTGPEATATRRSMVDMVILPALNTLGINKLDGVIWTHGHDDHIGGAARLLATHPVGWIGVSPADQYPPLILSQKTVRRLNPGTRIQLEPEVFITLLGPILPSHSQDLENDSSLVFRLDYRRISMLFTGDLSDTGEQELMTRLPAHLLRASILKVGHHGSRTSSSEPFISAVSPRLALISVGRKNKFGHPSPETLKRFSAHHIPVMTTALSGAITIETTGTDIRVREYLSRR